jgi:hypothetical protein
MIDLEATEADLRKERLVDRGRLKPGGHQEVLDEIERLERTRGLHAHVLLLPVGDSPVDAKPLWDKLGLDGKRDLLFVSNGKSWEIRGWGLTRSQIDAAMAEAGPSFKQYLGKGVTISLRSLASLVGAPSAASSSSSGGGSHGLSIGFGIAGALVAAGIGFAIYRRNKRASESRGDFDAAKTSAERAYTDLILASEDLAGNAGSPLQLKAAELKKQLDAIVADADGKPDRMSDRVVLGKISQIESELAALRSTQLQKARQ